MEIRMSGSTVARLCQIGLAALWLSSPAAAELVNIDLEGDSLNDTTHIGNDGVLSTVGTVWNGVDSGVDAFALLDALGAVTAVDVVFSATGGGATDPLATNDLQDSGSVRVFTVQGLNAIALYDVAIYGVPGSFIGFTDASGLDAGLCSAAPTYALPGTLDDDYCLFEARMPADLGGGVYGFTVSPLDGVPTALQILSAGGDPPDVPVLALPGILGLSLCLLGFGVYSTRSENA